jgi:5-methylcytosine-specific restriction endonuclease McrBC regulatory subunit McrC
MLFVQKKGNIHVKPDFSFWELDDCRLVGDCKYKKLTKKIPGENLEGFEDDVGALTPDLYQLLTYTIATKLNNGFLIYADEYSPSGKPGLPIKFADLQPVNTDTVLKRRALNLNVEPAQILEQIEAIAQELVESIKLTKLKKKAKQ